MMNRDELIALGKRIVNCDADSEEELNALCLLFNENVLDPAGCSRFYYPENFNSRKDDLSKYNPTVEEVVDHLLAYKPIQL